mgnify:CR=1 FL=1
MIGHRSYIASWWRNQCQPKLVIRLRREGHQVYDFRNPPSGSGGFSWREIDGDWESWNTASYRNALWHPKAEAGYKDDMDALTTAQIVVLLLPSGRSAHVEAGYFRGIGGIVVVHISQLSEPELMYKMFNSITETDDELVTLLSKPLPELRALNMSQLAITVGKA